MKRIHVKHGMKKVLAFSLAAAMVVPGALVSGSLQVSAEDSLPQPARYYDLERGFRGETDKDGAVIAEKQLKQAKFGHLIGMIEDTYPVGSPYAGEKYHDPQTGRMTGQLKKVNTVLVEGSFDPEKHKGAQYQKGYEQAVIPEDETEREQFLPETSDTDGSWQQFNAAWNQPTTAYDEEKGMVFWLEDTLRNKSYPTYATTVNEEKGTWDTDMSKIVKDTAGHYQEYEILNSAAEFDNPFIDASATGMTFSAWIKNTKPYKEATVYKQLGNLNGDDRIDAFDALAVLDIVANPSAYDATAKLYADVDGKDGVTPLDALMILDYVASGGRLKFTGKEPEGSAVGEVKPLDDSEFFHVEIRKVGRRKNPLTQLEEDDDKDIQKRQYLYFSGNGVTYVGDATATEKENAKAYTWSLPEESKGKPELDLLSSMNGSKWNYVSYTFDGEDFHMYINGKDVKLARDFEDAEADYGNEIMEFVADPEAVTYLGGRGGGIGRGKAGDFNAYAIDTSSDYYMDDIAVYTCGLTEVQVKLAYEEAAADFEAEKAKKENMDIEPIKTYSFNGTTLAEAELKALPGITTVYPPDLNTFGKEGAGIQIKTSYQMQAGGVQLAENPFQNGSDLTGVTISYWISPFATKRGVVDEGVVLSFIDSPKECTHEKVGESYTGVNAIARSQLQFGNAFVGSFCEGATKAVNTSLKNNFSYSPCPFGDPANIKESWKKDLETYYEDWRDNIKFAMGTIPADREKGNINWQFVTVTINNAGFKMYWNGELIENRKVDFKGERFCDFYSGRTVEITRSGGNNGGARSLMDFITAKDTEVYLGFAYEGSEETYATSLDCYMDEVSFYDQYLTAEQVKALYNKVK